MANHLMTIQAYSVVNQWLFKTKIMVEKSTMLTKAMTALTTLTTMRARLLASSKKGEGDHQSQTATTMDRRQARALFVVKVEPRAIWPRTLSSSRMLARKTCRSNRLPRGKSPRSSKRLRRSRSSKRFLALKTSWKSLARLSAILMKYQFLS
jgi:hypothetical protein